MSHRANAAATFCATLVDEWIHHGVRHAVVAPGSRSTPLALAAAARPEIDVHVFHDERSASFAALGIGLLGVPALLVCTSGTAAAHFHAAVIEAHQSAVPLLVCTADRPPELRDVSAPQTIDQTKLYGDAVRWFHDPGVADRALVTTWRSLAARAYAAATGPWPGAVHLNLPFREPLLGDPDELPLRASTGPVALPTRFAADQPAVAAVGALLTGSGLIVAGRGCGDAEAVHDLAAALRWPILADARSGLRHLDDVAVSAADHLLRHPAFAAAQTPSVVLRMGETHASKVVNQWLASSGAVQLHVGATPSWPDADAVLHHRVVAEPAAFCRGLAEFVAENDGGVPDAWLPSWIDAEAGAQARLSSALEADELSEPAVARAIATLLPTPAHLVVSSSMPIRDVEWFGVIPADVTVHSNRGANGIDGVLATAIGVAIAAQATTGLLIGDVAVLHDSSSLVALARRPIDLRIVVIDNDGGGIFNFLPQATSLPAARFEQLFGTPHGTDIVALAAAHGIPARTAVTRADLVAALAAPGPSLVRVATDRAANVAVHERLNTLMRE